MYATIPRQARRRHHKIDALKALPLEPLDFCKKWLSYDPNVRGSYTRCVEELEKVTGAKTRTIQGWGPDFSKRPDYVVKILRREDLLRQIREVVREIDNLSE